MFVAETGVFIDAVPVAAQLFIVIEPAVMQAAKEYHMASDGDQEDVYEIVRNSNLGVYGAYVYE